MPAIRPAAIDSNRHCSSPPNSNLHCSSLPSSIPHYSSPQNSSQRCSTLWGQSRSKEACWALNVPAVEHLIKACKKHDAQLIHLSTDFIFDGLAGPYREEDEPSPVSFYGESKLAAELLLKKSDIKWAILRTIIVYGVVNDMSRSNIILWAKGALEKGNPINVVDDQWRMPTLADDLAEICLLAAAKEARGVYNASGKDMMSILELVQEVAD